MVKIETFNLETKFKVFWCVIFSWLDTIAAHISLLLLPLHDRCENTFRQDLKYLMVKNTLDEFSINL